MTTLDRRSIGPGFSTTPDDQGLDHRLFLAWQSGDPDARRDAWTRMFVYLKRHALNICQRYASDPTEALEWASDATGAAFEAVDRSLQDGYDWEGEPRFVGLLRSRVVFAARKRCEVGVRWRKRALQPGSGSTDDGAYAPLDRLLVLPTQGQQEMAIALTVDTVRRIVARLAMTRERCRHRPALASTIDAMLAYVRECCARAVDDGPTDGASIDQLIPRMNRSDFEASGSEMNQFILRTLAISRNELDCRRREIRKLAVEWPRPADAVPISGTPALRDDRRSPR